MGGKREKEGKRWERVCQGWGKGGGVPGLWASRGAALHGSSLKGGKMDFFKQPQSLYCCTKACIDDGERSAWPGQSWVCSAGSLGRPVAKGAQTVPGCQAPALEHQAPTPRLLTNTQAPGPGEGPPDSCIPGSENPQNPQGGTQRWALRVGVRMGREGERDLG